MSCLTMHYCGVTTYEHSFGPILRYKKKIDTDLHSAVLSCTVHSCFVFFF